jgi:hypothetical protein
MEDLAREQRGKHGEPLVPGHRIGDFARECRVARLESLRELVQRLPELLLDLGRAFRVLDVLGRQVSHEPVRMVVGDEHRLEHGGRAARGARGELQHLGRDAALRDHGVIGRQRGDPALGGSRVAEGL